MSCNNEVEDQYKLAPPTFVGPSSSMDNELNIQVTGVSLPKQESQKRAWAKLFEKHKAKAMPKDSTVKAKGVKPVQDIQSTSTSLTLDSQGQHRNEPLQKMPRLGLHDTRPNTTSTSTSTSQLREMSVEPDKNSEPVEEKTGRASPELNNNQCMSGNKNTRPNRKTYDKNRKIQDDWFKVFTWLKVEDGLMLCTKCIESKKKNIFTSGKPLDSIPKKDDLVKHSRSRDHRMSQHAKTGRLEWNKAKSTAYERAREAVVAQMRTVLAQAQNSIPTNKNQALVELQILNVGAAKLVTLIKSCIFL